MSAVAIPARAVPSRELEPHERRSCNRYPIRLEVEYTLSERSRMKRFGHGRTVNVSSHGILFEADDALPTGASINLAIEWPFLLDGECCLKLQVRGRIIRSKGEKVAVQIAHHEFRTAGFSLWGTA
jgi:hypothetical protein